MTPGLLESYEQTRYVEELLEKAEGMASLDHPSLSRMLVPEQWFQVPIPKPDDCSSYWMTSELTGHFLCLSNDAKVLFDNGCMAAELLDYRAKRSRDSEPEKRDRTRVILRPIPEPLYSGVCALNARSEPNLADRDALNTNSKLLLATAPLWLDPTPHLT
ncbi:hypothetical protein BKA70DRAFT_1541250 [Coprinopsis sp. MPI-PUGE-AT-0042]|nr:hypothetical protein BKA70DRAFT_1541250 [Coprinopsis sp. MPI-PUGE-AT-0042]